MGHKPRYPFFSFLFPMFDKMTQGVAYTANLAPSQIPTQGWMYLSRTTPRRHPNRGMLPDTYDGTVLTAQTILRGVTPIDNMHLAVLRQRRANVTG